MEQRLLFLLRWFLRQFWSGFPAEVVAVAGAPSGKRRFLAAEDGTVIDWETVVEWNSVVSWKSFIAPGSPEWQTANPFLTTSARELSSAQYMSLPLDPTLETSRGKYELGQPRIREVIDQSPIHNSMSNPERQELPTTVGGKIQNKMDRFRDFVGRTCCSCVTKMPSLVLIIFICLMIAFLLAIIPAVFILSNAVSGETQSQQAGGVDMDILRSGHKMPPFDLDALDEEDSSPFSMHGIPSSSLFPPNVSLCHGFGFACSNQPDFVISTTKRCDGRDDCPDASDEVNCKECQTTFSCPAEKEGRVICLLPELLCDGVSHCPNGWDEDVPCKSKCESPDDFKCPTANLCIPKTSVCDGEIDCPGQEDENECKKCFGGSKMCKPTKECMSKSILCDGVSNCPDGSDEEDCDCVSCSGSGRALCDDKRCLERSQVCDGVSDCEDGMDEQNCPGTCAKPDGKKDNKQSSWIKCSDNKRYPEKEACSGLLEQCNTNCPKCNSDAYTCKNKKVKQCIPRMMICDGIPDCEEGDDEANCKCDVAGGMFKCLKGNKCVPQSQRCDGVWDCKDGSDEKECAKCPSGSLRCKSDKMCLPGLARCDGIADCEDGSDEADCSCLECTGLHSNTYMCDGSHKCFRRDQVCSPYTICPNATMTDKVFCASMALSRMEL